MTRPRVVFPGPLVVPVLALLVAIGAATAAGADTGPIRVRDLPGLKARQVLLLREGANESHERLLELRAASRHRPGRGATGRRPRLVEAEPVPGPVPRASEPARPAGAMAFPPNIRVNDPTGEGMITQSEQHVGFAGSLGVAAWNDGVGPNYEGWATTTDGGATWTDRGTLPIAPAGGNWRGDPVVAVDEKSATFYVAGLYFPTSTTTAVAVARGRFTGAAFNWENVSVVRSAPQATDFMDKEWVVADSLSGNVYLSYTHFTTTGDSIIFQRSTDQGGTWGPMLTLNSAATQGWVQGSRPAVGPAGELYVEWYEIGMVDADFYRVAKSTDRGLSFGAPVLAGTAYTNWGNGAPGFNRYGGIQFASIAVDRSLGANRGRVYLAWPEAVNYYADVLGTGGAKLELETNNSAATATPFTPGVILRGQFSSVTDADWYSFSATAGTSYVFVCDSIPSALYAMRVMCSDQITSLALSGDNAGTDGTGGYGQIVWTAPGSGTYYLQMSFLNVAPSAPGRYRVYSGVHTAQPGDRARDARDAAVAGSADGLAFGAPTRPDDDPVGFDDWLPELAAAGDGAVYASWMDWRDLQLDCGGASNTYLTRSTDGGASWAPNVRLSDTRSQWTFVASNLAPNQGDYMGMYGGAVMNVVWADGRSGNPDVYTTTLDPGYTVGCVRDTAANPADVIAFPFHLFNRNSQFGNAYQVTLGDARGWTSGAPPAPVVVAAGQTLLAPVSVAIPDTAAAGANRVTFVWRTGGGALPETCAVTITVNAVAGVGPGGTRAFGIRSLDPNPARGRVAIQFALPEAGTATLEVLDLAGRRCVAREVGAFGAGAHTVVLERELARLPAGVYAVRLRQAGHTHTVKLSLMR